MWSHTQDGAEPDMIVTGKGLSGGLVPISATLMTRALHAFFDEQPFVHISTFGGAELGCVAGLAVLDIVERPGFLDRVQRLGSALEAGLDGLPLSVRRRGLFAGLKFADEAGGMAATQRVISAGVFAIFANNDPSVLQLLPPLTISDDEMAWLVQRLQEVLR